ncbi:Hypothetical predicted protein [Pelobates cultripes]|uniref:Uncharacterized protein n=1 Tax=Pelobates cultripes TaxID=61616 RepID=A0AAD1W569_PELCU|nr:Hypothetical predicted protein [Pelobates cultripes]
MFQADCALIQEDMHTLSGGIKSIKDEAATAHQTHLGAALLAQQLTQQPTVTGLEDTQRRRYLKIRGVSSDIGIEEVPQYVRRLLSSLLPTKQVKSMPIEGIYRVGRTRRLMTTPLRDVIVTFRSLADKRAMISAV